MNRKDQIEERREKILSLQNEGYTQNEIIRQLGITRMTMSRDMRSTNAITKKGMFGIAKNETLSTFFYNCVQSVNEVTKECWKIYRDNNSEWIRTWSGRVLKLNLTCSRVFQDIWSWKGYELKLNILKKRPLTIGAIS